MIFGSKNPPAERYLKFRELVFEVSASRKGLLPTPAMHTVWGLIMEHEEIFRGTFAAFADGWIGQAFAPGHGRSVARPSKEIRTAIADVIELAERNLDRFVEYDPEASPAKYEYALYLRTFRGTKQAFVRPPDWPPTQVELQKLLRATINLQMMMVKQHRSRGFSRRL
jgi:hypothetical protein